MGWCSRIMVFLKKVETTNAQSENFKSKKFNK